MDQRISGRLDHVRDPEPIPGDRHAGIELTAMDREIRAGADAEHRHSGRTSGRDPGVQHALVVQSVDAMHDEISVLDHAQRNPDLLLILDPLIDSRHIDPPNDEPAKIDRHPHVIPGGPRPVRDERHTLPNQRVEQRRLPNVRPTDRDHQRRVQQAIEPIAHNPDALGILDRGNPHRRPSLILLKQQINAHRARTASQGERAPRLDLRSGFGIQHDGINRRAARDTSLFKLRADLMNDGNPAVRHQHRGTPIETEHHTIIEPEQVHASQLMRFDLGQPDLTH